MTELKHLPQLVNLITGLYTRVGKPLQHLAGGTETDLISPIYATAVGLLMKGLADKKNYEFYEYEEELQNDSTLPKTDDTNKNPKDEETSGIKDKVNGKKKKPENMQEKRKNRFYKAIWDFLKKLE